MRRLIHKLCDLLCQFKGFETGYTSSCGSKMMLDFEGKRYIISVFELPNPEQDMAVDITKYLSGR